MLSNFNHVKFPWGPGMLAVDGAAEQRRGLLLKGSCLWLKWSEGKGSQLESSKRAQLRGCRAPWWRAECPRRCPLPGAAVLYPGFGLGCRCLALRLLQEVLGRAVWWGCAQDSSTCKSREGLGTPLSCGELPLAGWCTGSPEGEGTATTGRHLWKVMAWWPLVWTPVVFFLLRSAPSPLCSAPPRVSLLRKLGG